MLDCEFPSVMEETMLADSCVTLTPWIIKQAISIVFCQVWMVIGQSIPRSIMYSCESFTNKVCGHVLLNFYPPRQKQETKDQYVASILCIIWKIPVCT